MTAATERSRTADTPGSPDTHARGRGHPTQHGRRERRHDVPRTVVLNATRDGVVDDDGSNALVTYHGASIRTSMIRACFSPDGKTVVAGSEEGQCNVWNAWVTNESGSLITPQTRKVSKMKWQYRYGLQMT